VRALKEWCGYSIQEGCQLVDSPISSYFYANHKPYERQLERDLKIVVSQIPAMAVAGPYIFAGALLDLVFLAAKDLSWNCWSQLVPVLLI
jgi:hypothetical protein